MQSNQKEAIKEPNEMEIKHSADFITSKEWSVEALLRNSLEPYPIAVHFQCKDHV